MYDFFGLAQCFCYTYSSIFPISYISHFLVRFHFLFFFVFLNCRSTANYYTLLYSTQDILLQQPVMKVLRRSLHKEKERTSPTRADFHQRAVNKPPTQPFASLATGSNNSSANTRPIGKPPTLVIKAITPYKSNRIVELSFQKGDFFHVVGERDDHEGSWFEASNPATGARGIVPKHCFELLGRKQKELSNTTTNTNTTSSAYPPRSSAPGFHMNQPNSPLPIRAPLSAEPFRNHHNNHHGSKTQPLYGIVRPHPFQSLNTWISPLTYLRFFLI
jgi:hypothetical protein